SRPCREVHPLQELQRLLLANGIADVDLVFSRWEAISETIRQIFFFSDFAIHIPKLKLLGRAYLSRFSGFLVFGPVMT
ncbi:Unknown protein, partial [Striga hermonthica]